MAVISLQEIINSLILKENQQYNNAVAMIDQSLRRYDREAALSINLLVGTYESVFNKLIAVYSAPDKGWTVIRCGTSLTFSEAGLTYKVGPIIVNWNTEEFYT